MLAQPEPFKKFSLNRNNVFDSFMDFFAIDNKRIRSNKNANVFGIADKFLQNCTTLDDVIESHMDALLVILGAVYDEEFCHREGEQKHWICSDSEEFECYICQFMKPFLI